MPWSGGGTYALPPAYSPEVNGSVIDATRYNGLTADVASGITAALAKNGENVPTANLPMGSFKHTGAGAATTAGDYLVFGGAATLTDLTTTGNTILGNAITDTFNQGAGSLVKNATGNWTIGAPSSGVSLLIANIAGQSAYQWSDGTRSGAIQTSVAGNFIGSLSADPFNIFTNGIIRVAVANAGNVTVNAPSSGVALTASGGIQENGAGVIGYAAGSGGTVTQLTSKSTTVVLNKTVGQITMNNASLAAGASISFIVTNSLVTQTDVVICHRGNNFGGDRNYRVETDRVATSSIVITVTNLSAGALAEAVVINFAVIKGSIT